MKTSEADILIVPGWLNSGPDHWQSRWERNLKTARRIEQDNWHAPDKDEWSGNIVKAVEAARAPPCWWRTVSASSPSPTRRRSFRRAVWPAPSWWRRPTSTIRMAGRRTRATLGRRRATASHPYPCAVAVSLAAAGGGRRPLLLPGAGEGLCPRLGFDFCGCRASRPHSRSVGTWPLAGRPAAVRPVPGRPQRLRLRPFRPPRYRRPPWPASRPWRRGSQHPSPSRRRRRSRCVACGKRRRHPSPRGRL